MTVNWSQIAHFAPHEFICQGLTCCGGAERMDGDFVLRLDALRKALGKPLLVTSGYRCPEHNDRVSSTGRTGPHTTGRAADLALVGRDAFVVLRMAFDFGFTGIGLKQHGPHGRRFVHLDTLPDAPGQPRPWVWTY
jgi:uncharacterized protein YcbK (DUF882 family)